MPSRPLATPLPIDPLLPDALASLRKAGALVLQAPPGAGKTTRVPRALLDAGVAQAGDILVEQPRRLATRLAAERVADELGEPAGATIGYTVRFEDRSGPATRVRFVTEGVLLRRLLADPALPGVAAVVLDEFHERHLATDLALALLAELRRTRRPDLQLVVMSATLDAGPVADFLGGCPVLTSEGRAFPVDIQHEDAREERPMPDQVAGAVRRLLREPDLAGGQGDVLVFLPGAGEIRRVAEALAPLAAQHDLLLLPLHGDLPLAEQNRAVRPAARRKVILSTNVAETSVTIDGVVAVIDAGLARIASHSPWTGLPTLKVGKISQASAIQRAGRAGRTRPGRALRLYSRHDFETRPAHDLPEVARLDLAEALLALHALGVKRPETFAWFEEPPGAALAAGEALLRQLGAVDEDGTPTAIGRRLLRFPVHPRLGRLLVEADARGVGLAGAALAALLGERDVRERARVSFDRAGGGGESADLFEVLDLFEQARAARFSRERMRALGLDGRAVEAAERAARQLERQLSDARATAKVRDADARDGALALAVLAGFPDRVAKRRVAAQPGRSPRAERTDTPASEVVLAGGGSAAIGPTPKGDLLVVVDAAERDGRRNQGHAGGAGVGARVTVRLAVPIEAEGLLELCPDGVRDETELRWNPDSERVERALRLAYGQVVLDESRRPAEPSPEAAKLLLAAARAAGPRAFADPEAVNALAARIAAAREAGGAGELPALDDEVLLDLLTRACTDATSFAELRAQDLLALWTASLPKAAQALLAQLPSRVRLPGGREVKVNYEPGRPPWIESRLQDFFGMKTGPAVLGGRLPLTLHLLAPNGRAVQVTQDLAGFWAKHYPPLRRELGRRYPRHQWPEDGAGATPPPGGRIRPPR